MIMGQRGTFDLANPESRIGKKQSTCSSQLPFPCPAFLEAFLATPWTPAAAWTRGKSWFSCTLRADRHLQEQLGSGAAVWVGKEAFCCSGAATIYGEIAHTNHFATILL